MDTSKKSAHEILEIIRSLASDQGENPEYDSAMAEVGAHLLGLADAYSDNPDLVAYLILGPFKG